MANKTIPQLIAEYKAAEKVTKEAYEYAKSCATAQAEAKDRIDAALKAAGLKTAATEDGRFTAFYSKRTNIKVSDEAKVIDWIKANGLDLDQYVGLKATEFKPVAMEALKQTGEIVPGTEREEVEALTVKENKSNGQK